MLKTYRANDTFMVSMDGRPHFFVKDNVYELKLTSLPKGVRGAFTEVVFADDKPVEKATAAPGEKRAVGRPKKTAAKATDK